MVGLWFEVYFEINIGKAKDTNLFCLQAFEYDFSQYENVVKWFGNTKKALEPYGYEEIDVAGAQMLAQFLKSHSS